MVIVNATQASSTSLSLIWAVERRKWRAAYCFSAGSDSLATLSQGIYAYVTLSEGVDMTDDLRKELIMAVREEIGGSLKHIRSAKFFLYGLSAH
eukprot:CAMPEP_0206150944 /NCGR_PEP_ID=MMETSP1473-20131121/38564_1 /ASSEMBLY_ACC=CAM_ASM_001109 /TAXON_ID=1461547 /ORGANISM="Stichococcus sp, Strain RCC1054" /LENGTH=93 /DNA_ID=CAMNT_0053548475 /DNA_START=1150 /DNA_END=1432 /DNA_ORIENTATION=+